YQKELEGNIEKLKAIDKLKNEFISLASHQLRTPLTAMKWFLEMMVNGEMGEVSLPQKGGLENIYKSNERMIALVNALLNVSRLDTGRVAVNPRPTRLRELVDSVTSDFQVMIKNKNFQIILNEAPNLPQISIDPQLIRIVYSNLLSNAIRYTPAGGQITISLYPKENFIISEIKDTGYGIPQTEQGRVFEKFFRASNIVRIDTEGTGLGLYLTRAIIESSGGKIWFESIEGRGTTFYFSLPLEGSLAKPGEVGVEQTK
ncbi:HAMP domain-containing histidine kinase, partial [Candidatus Woesebacteria bacterium]|nr:HAMP domain-containing histidine kinase [Candidatus Woesebacteria bacterium]